MMGKSGEGVNSSKPGEQQEPIISQYGFRWYKLVLWAEIVRLVFQARIGLLLAKMTRQIFPLDLAYRSNVRGYDRRSETLLSDLAISSIHRPSNCRHTVMESERRTAWLVHPGNTTNPGQAYEWL